MKKFDYIRPATLDEAIAAGSAPGAAYLASGTNLVDLMKTGGMRPDTLVDITRLPGLSSIDTVSGGGHRIGALVRNSDLSRDPAIVAAYPAMVEAMLSGASGQLRNAATLGGNLAQHTRCGFFADGLSLCNRREPGSGCAALGSGETRGFAVLGWSDSCIATHPSDLCVALAALGAVVEIAGPSGRREVPMAEFHRLPGDAPERETVLEHGELVIAVRLPAEAAGFAGHGRYVKLRDRTSYAFALVSVAALLRIEGGVIAEARLALGGVAARPWRALTAEALLVGAAPDRDAFAEAATAALADARPVEGNDAKIELARRTVVRALALAAEGTPDRTPALPGSPFSSLPGDLAHV